MERTYGENSDHLEGEKEEKVLDGEEEKKKERVEEKEENDEDLGSGRRRRRRKMRSTRTRRRGRETLSINMESEWRGQMGRFILRINSNFSTKYISK